LTAPPTESQPLNIAIAGLDSDRRSGVREKLQPVSATFAADDSTDQSVRTNDRSITGDGYLLGSPHLHRSRAQVTESAASDDRTCLELGSNARQATGLAECGQVLSQEQVTSPEVLQLKPHPLVVCDHSLEVGQTDTDIDEAITNPLDTPNDRA
jgi:hypothetical protein